MSHAADTNGRETFLGILRAVGRKTAIRVETAPVEGPDEEYCVTVSTFAGMGTVHHTTKEFIMDAATLTAWKEEVSL